MRRVWPSATPSSFRTRSAVSTPRPNAPPAARSCRRGSPRRRPAPRTPRPWPTRAQRPGRRPRPLDAVPDLVDNPGGVEARDHREGDGDHAVHEARAQLPVVGVDTRGVDRDARLTRAGVRFGNVVLEARTSGPPYCAYCRAYMIRLPFATPRKPGVVDRRITSSGDVAQSGVATKGAAMARSDYVRGFSPDFWLLVGRIDAAGLLGVDGEEGGSLRQRRRGAAERGTDAWWSHQSHSRSARAPVAGLAARSMALQSARPCARWRAGRPRRGA